MKHIGTGYGLWGDRNADMELKAGRVWEENIMGRRGGWPWG